MNFWLEIIFFCLLIGIYGYILERKISQSYYTLTNLVAGVGFVLIAKAWGVSWQSLGFSSGHLFKGLAFGLLIFLPLLALVVSALFLKKSKTSFSGSDIYEILIRIPLGTALAEELIFRAALLGLLLTHFGKISALVLSAVVFAFWHLLPNPMSNWSHENLFHRLHVDWHRKTASSSLTLVVTGTGGLAFAILRLVSGSILTPWLAHSSINITGWIFDKKIDLRRAKS